MKSIKKLAVGTAVVSTMFLLGACGTMSARDQNTAVGAGIGAVGGAVLTGGSAIGTIGGAAVGGVIGNQVDDRNR